MKYTPSKRPNMPGTISKSENCIKEGTEVIIIALTRRAKSVYYRTAMTSISTPTSFGSFATCTALLAGSAGASLKASA